MTAPSGLSTVHNCTLTTHKGGSYAVLRPPPCPAEVTPRGGVRGAVSGFSRASRRRLMRLVNSVDTGSVARPVFLTLTYPGAWPRDPRRWKAHLRAFRERMERKYGKFSAIWRLEFQKRGAPHFHLLLFLDRPPSTLREFISTSWYEVVDSGDDRHLRAGTNAVSVRSWRGVRSYAAKYLGKLDDLDELPQEDIGRFWGVWRKELLPITAENHQLTLDQFFRLRRVLRRYARIRSTHRVGSFGCFVDYDVTNRLLSSAGYYLE